jgi:hypothetical protein
VYDARRDYSGEDVSPSVPGPFPEEQANNPPELVTLHETNGFPASHRVVPKDTVSLIQEQAERIAILEDRLARLDPTQATTNDGSRNVAVKPLGWLEAHSQRVSSDEFRTLDTVAVGHEEAFVFRGNGFKTQFYGPSSPMSAIFNSAIIIKSVGGFLMNFPIICIKSPYARFRCIDSPACIWPFRTGLANAAFLFERLYAKSTAKSC